jgi:cytochrome c oxidase subunit 2
VATAAAATVGGEAVTRRGLLGLVLAAAAGAAAAPQGPAAVEVRASKRGFEPSQVTLRRGETAHLVLSSADGEHCFAIDALRLEKRIVPGRPTRFDLTPDRAGTFPFYCCLESGDAAARERGELVVTE